MEILLDIARPYFTEHLQEFDTCVFLHDRGPSLNATEIIRVLLYSLVTLFNDEGPFMLFLLPGLQYIK